MVAAALVATLIGASTESVEAAIAQRGTATTGTSQGASQTINKPAGVVAGDVMIVNIAKYYNDNTAPTLSGWTKIDSKTLGGSRYGAVLYRVADGTESTSFTFTIASSYISGSSASSAIVAFSGVDTVNGPFDVANTTIVTANNSSTATATSKTTVTTNSAIIMFGMAVGTIPTATWSTWTSPAGLTELYDNQITGTGEGTSIGAAWATKLIPGATGSGYATLSSKEYNGGLLVALKPRATPSITGITANQTITYGTISITLTGKVQTSGF